MNDPLIVLIPTRGTVAAELVTALINNTDGYGIVLRMINREAVDVARNRLADLALETAADATRFAPGGDPLVLWVDSDAFFIAGTLTLMLDTLEKNPSIDVLAALFGPRAAERGAAAYRDGNDRHSMLMPGANFTRGELVDVDQTGMHFVLHRVSLLRALGPNPFGEPGAPNTDDAAFCARVRHGNGRITVATGIPVFHVDERNGTAYSPGVPACRIDGNAIDLTQLGEELEPETRAYGDRIDSAVRTRDELG